MTHHSGRVAFERFWYARGPMLLAGLAYGIPLMLAVLTIRSLGDAPASRRGGETIAPVVEAAHILAPALQVRATPIRLGGSLESTKVAACP